MKPIWWIDDYETIRDRVGCVELANWSCIELLGPDRGHLLNSLGTNLLDDMEPGKGCETFLTGPRGHVVAHGIVFADEELTLLITTAPRGGTIVDHLSKYIIREDVQVVDRSVQTAMWYCGGHTAQDLLEGLGIPVPHEPGEHVNATLADAPVRACRVDITGPVGFLLVVPREHARSVAGVLQQAEVKICVREAFDSARIQWGWPFDDVDISGTNFPQEVGRDDRAISFTKGCYLGQETVARIDSLGHVNKRLTLVRFPGGKLSVSADLFVQGKPVGTTTSMGYSPEFSCPVGLGYVRREWAEPGTILESSIGRAETVPLGWLASVP
jgi:tRNA-modifying protein YgfZ